MPEKYEIEIDDRAVLVVVRQYDSDGEEVVISNISVPDRAGELRTEAGTSKHSCPFCDGTGIEGPLGGLRNNCSNCNGTGQE